MNIDILENQMSLFDEEPKKDTPDSVEELLSYEIDKYYYENIEGKSMTFRKIEEELSRLPRYNIYMKKLGEYLKTLLPTMTYEELGNDFKTKCLIETDSVGYRINGNRMQFTAYCLQQYMTTFEKKSLF